MSDERYDLVFKGQLAKSVAKDVAVRNLAQLFKIEPAKALGLFSGKETVLKKNLDLDTANKYRAVIKKAGAIVELKLKDVPSSAAPAEKPPASASAAAPAPKAVGKAVFGVQEPQHSQTGASQSSTPGTQKDAPPPLPTVAVEEVADDDDGFTTSAGVFSDPRPEPVDFPVPNLDVAEAGADLLPAGARHQIPVAEIDTSALSVREAEGNLLDESEYRVDIPLPAVDADFEVEPPGADVLKPEERKQRKAVEVDTSSLSVAEPGGNLAPPKPAAPPPPDTSSISLADQ